MAIVTREDFFGCRTGIKTRLLFPTSRLVSGLTGLPVQRNKAIVGENAFAHEAGVHQDGFLKERTTYEIIRPEDVGVPAARLVLGKHSGRHALRVRVASMGHHLTPEQITQVYERFTVLADKKKEIFDADILALIEEEMSEAPATFELESFHVSSGDATVPTAMVRMRTSDGTEKQDAACGDGPVDAVYKTIDRITGISGKLVDYSIRAITSGKDAQGEVVLAVDFNGKRFSGKASSTDIIQASAQAYIKALNRAVAQADAAGEKSKTAAKRGASKAGVRKVGKTKAGKAAGSRRRR